MRILQLLAPRLWQKFLHQNKAQADTQKAVFFASGVSVMQQNPTFPVPLRLIDRHAMTAAQVKRFVLRVGLFQRRGMSADQSDAWADRLHDRDSDSGDKRHICFECKHFQAARKTCFKVNTTSPYQLVSCVGFDWQTP